MSGKKPNNRKRARKGKAPVQNRPARKQATAGPKGRVSGGEIIKTATLSECAREYAKTLADPKNFMACIPSYPALFTRKIRVYSKGTFVTSVTAGGVGFGFIVLSPLRGAANDASWINFSLGTYAAATIAVMPTVGVGFAQSNSDYTASQFGAGNLLAQPRVVGATLSIRYVGTELNRGGQAVGLHEPNHNTLVGATFAVVDGFQESKRLPVDREWLTLAYRPVDNGDLNFSDNPVPAVYGPDSNYMAFVLQDPAVQMVMEYEAYAVYEIQGRNIRGKTPSHVDFAGFGAAHSATQLSNVLTQPIKGNSRAPVVEAFVNAAASVLGTQTSSTQHSIVPYNAPSAGSSSSSGWSDLLSKVDWSSIAKTGMSMAGDLLAMI